MPVAVTVVSHWYGATVVGADVIDVSLVTSLHEFSAEKVTLYQLNGNNMCGAVLLRLLGHCYVHVISAQ